MAVDAVFLHQPLLKKMYRCLFVWQRICDLVQHKSLQSFLARTTFTTGFFTTVVASPGFAVIKPHVQTIFENFNFGLLQVRADNIYRLVVGYLTYIIHFLYKFRAAVRVNKVITRVRAVINSLSIERHGITHSPCTGKTPLNHSKIRTTKA